MDKYVYSSSPHIKSPRTTRQIMLNVCLALLPACIAGCVYFGWKAVVVMAIACVAAVASEWVYRLCCKVPFDKIIKEFDFTSLVTGMLVGMNMYSTSKWYAVLLASVFAVVVVKMLFGGTGKNIVNPAIAGRIFAFISFGAAFGGEITATPTLSGASTGLSGGTVTTGATPLGALFGGEVTSTLSTWDLLLGTGMAGSIGETCKIALIIGGAYLVIRGMLNFRWPLVYIITTGLFTVALNGFDFGVFLPSVLSGGLILGAVFMATDFVTTPNTKAGNYVYFIALGLLTAGLRQALKSEVVSFAILLMNLTVPLIDRYIVRRPFGYVKQKKTKAVTGARTDSSVPVASDAKEGK